MEAEAVSAVYGIAGMIAESQAYIKVIAFCLTMPGRLMNDEYIG